MGARNRVGIGLSYRPATGYMGWRNWLFRIGPGLLKSLKIRTQDSRWLQRHSYIPEFLIIKTSIESDKFILNVKLNSKQLLQNCDGRQKKNKSFLISTKPLPSPWEGELYHTFTDMKLKIESFPKIENHWVLLKGRIKCFAIYTLGYVCMYVAMWSIGVQWQKWTLK